MFDINNSGQASHIKLSFTERMKIQTNVFPYLVCSFFPSMFKRMLTLKSSQSKCLISQSTDTEHIQKWGKIKDLQRLMDILQQ